MNMMK